MICLQLHDAATTSGPGLLPAPPRDLLAAPLSPFETSAASKRLVRSVGSGWDGAFLAEATAVAAGEVHQAHELVQIQRWLTPLRTRPKTGRGGWITHAPGVRVCLPGDAERAEWRGAPRLQLLIVTPARVEAVLGRPWHRSGLARWRDPRFELPFVADVLSAMLADVEAGYPAGPVTGDALLVALLRHLDASAPPPARRVERRIERVREHVEANLAGPLGVAELARVAGLGPRRFGTLFAAETGRSPHQYVLHRRIERARVLMRDPALTLARIARAVGFNDPAQLSRVFRRVTGETPSAHRRR